MMRIQFTFREWALVGLSVASAVACSSSSDGPAPVAESDYPNALAAAICDNIQSCCAQSGFVYNAAACKYVVSGNMPTHAHPGMRYDANAAGKCVAESAAEARACSFNDVPVDCARIYVGALGVGEPCSDSSQCAQSSGTFTYCNEQSQTCVLAPHGKMGDPCAGSCVSTSIGQSCSFSSPDFAVVCYESDGLFCSYQGGAQTCQLLSKAGQPCTSSEQCVTGTGCSYATGVCTPPAAAGQPCDASVGCVATAYCDSTGRCANLKPDGVSCYDQSECKSGNCNASGVCASSSGGVSATLCTGNSATP